MRSILPRRGIAGLLLAGLLAFPACAPAALAQTAAFTSPIAAKDAERVDAHVRLQRPGRQSAGDLKRAGLKLLAETKDPREAAKSLALAAAADGKDAGTWTALARAWLAIDPDASKGERYELPALAAGAAWKAYGTARDASGKAEALGVLAEALERRSLWRPAMQALTASLANAQDSAVGERLAKLRAQHGFRLVDYKVEADTAEPRLCLNFSERLAGAQGDLAKFATLDGRDPQNVTTEGRQMCFDGLKHGSRYEVKVRPGLPADTGEALTGPIEIAAYVRDRRPSVRFPGRAYVLPNRGQQGIPIVSVNTGKVALEIFRIGDRGLAGLAAGDNFLKQLQRYDIEAIREKSGQLVWHGELEIADRLNEDVTTALPVGEALTRLEPGVYIAAARPAKSAKPRGSDGDDEDSGNGETSTQWFIVSDLGMTALTGSDGLHAFVRSLATAEPAAGVTVRLVARNNEVLGTARTDAAGYVRFDPGLKRGEGGQTPALLVAETGQDYAFLDLSTSAFDLSDRGVKGREPPGPLDAYLFPERGVYRPGESVHLTGLVRDRNGRAATIPVTIVVSRPDGVEHRRMALPDQGLGGRTMALPIASSAMTGTWRARLYADPKGEPLAQVAFLVEDFMPERLALDLSPTTPALAVHETGRIGVAGRYLYGPPAANLDMEGEIIVRPSASDLPGLAGYRFGIAEEQISAVRRPLEETGATDEQGRATIAFQLPPLPRTQRLLEAEVLVRLKEPGGRSIERQVKLPVSTGEPRIGIRPLFNESVGQGEAAEFDVQMVGPDSKPVDAKNLKWELVRLDRRWQWYNRDNQWSHESVTTTRRVASGTAEAAGGKPARVSVTADWGRYRLEVKSDDAPGAITSVTFNAGWWEGENADSPETLDVALDKTVYKPGETAKLKIVSREAGRAQIAVLSGSLLMSRQVDVPAGGTEVALEVSAEWLPGAYVTATLYRPMDEKARRMPSRAVGIRWLAVDAASRSLKVAMDAPKTPVKPGSRLELPITLAGLAAGEEARVTVAAVDLGILNLTRHEAPAPEKWFNAQRRLGVELRDLYGRLIDGMRAERGRLRSGGDGAGGMSMKGSPPVEAPLALFSGIVTVGRDGKAHVGFDLPDFNGTVRLMAVAWSSDKTGSGTSDVIVREAVALTATAPRFLLLGDKARLDVDVHNIEGPAAAYRIQVAAESDGGTAQSLVARDVPLKTGERRAERIEIAPAAIGRTVYDVRVSGPNGIEVRRRVALEVKAPAGDIKRVVAASIAGAGGKLVLSKDLLADLIPGSARLSLVAGTLAKLDGASLLRQLDRYPYGCAEQTTSRALPLLYANQMAQRLGLANETEIRGRIEKAIDRVFEMQDAGGAFGVWGPDGGGDLWLTAYVVDFLTRAKEQGFAVRQQPFNQALDRLSNYLGYVQDFEKGGETRAYALYTLARNGRANVGDLRYYADTRLDRFSTPLAQAQLGAALALTGDRERAERAFRAAVETISKEAEGTRWNGARSDYGSFLRDGAALLTLVAETGTAKAAAPTLTDVLARVYRSRTYTSTQEQAWMLLAARAMSDAAAASTLSIDGQDMKGEITRDLDAAAVAERSVTIANPGDAPVDALVTVIGSSLTPEPAVAKGFTISREYYTLEGEKIDLKSADGGTSTLKQNDRLVVVLKIEGTETGGRVLLVDRLPAGLEIENPRLVEGGDVKGLDWLERGRQPVHTEFRDDRLVAAYDFFAAANGESNGSGKAATVAYIVRAVTPGAFVHPAATVEDMYRPERHARTATGRLTVAPTN